MVPRPAQLGVRLDYESLEIKGVSFPFAKSLQEVILAADLDRMEIPRDFRKIAVVYNEPQESEE